MTFGDASRLSLIIPEGRRRQSAGLIAKACIVEQGDLDRDRARIALVCSYENAIALYRRQSEGGRVLSFVDSIKHFVQRRALLRIEGMFAASRRGVCIAGFRPQLAEGFSEGALCKALMRFGCGQETAPDHHGCAAIGIRRIALSCGDRSASTKHQCGGYQEGGVQAP